MALLPVPAILILILAVRRDSLNREVWFFARK
jgi:hypothetical protein